MSQVESARLVQPAGVRLERADERGCFPLSQHQRDMWFQAELHARQALNQLGVLVTLQGPLVVAALHDSLQSAVERHETLRTCFREEAGRPVQRVVPKLSWDCPMTDLGGLPEAGRVPEVLAACASMVEEPLDLEQAPLFRARLFRSQEQLHYLVFVFHHLVLDGYHFVQLMEEVGRGYAELLSGGSGSLPVPALQYGDFARWQERRLDAGEMEDHADYWAEQLRQPLPAMQLPADRRGGAQRFETAAVVRQVDPGIVRQLKRVGRSARSTLYGTVVAAFQAWLQRVTGERDVLLAMPFSTRPRELRQVLGFFGNTLPLRADIDPNRSFHELLSATSARLREAGRRREFPLTELLRRSPLERGSQRPHFPIFVSQVRSFELRAGDLRLGCRFPFSHGSTFELWLVLLESQRGFELSFAYSRDRFDRSVVASWAASFERLLASVAAEPHARIRDLALLAEDEQPAPGGAEPGQPRPAWSDTLDELLERQVAVRPDAIAASCAGETRSYSQLRDQAEAIADELEQQRVGPEDRVGVFGSRGLGMLAALWAIERRGAAFVPLDPNQPAARLASILARAELRCIATESGLEDRARGLSGRLERPPSLLFWDRKPPPVGDPQARRLPGKAAGPRGLAYVFFTSGSTGEPKGAMVERAGMLNHLRSKVELLQLDAGSVVAQTASHCFDVSVWQFLAPLVAGGRVVIYPDDIAGDPSRLLEACRADRVTILETVPSLLEALLQELERRGPAPGVAGLEAMLATGEELPVELVRRWFSACPGVPLINAYGPTECSDDVTHHVMREAPAPEAARVPVGAPVSALRLHVLGSELERVPTGVAGQIAVGGVGVGRGYLRDPARTASSFLPDPFCRDAGARLYLTGDAGRWNAAGELELLGRLDHQVKLRGHRIELGEIEAALRAHPEVRACVVSLRGERGDSRLAAYVVMAPDSPVSDSDLRSFLSERLPRHMFPSSLTRLDRLPLNRSGKVDRGALPEPDPPERPEAGSTFVPPRGATQAAIAEEWCAVLGQSRVGAGDHFFDLGGHSLKAVELRFRIQRRLGVELPLRAFFEHPTLAAIAAVVDSARQRSVGAAPIPRQPAAEDYPLSRAQRRLWLSSQLDDDAGTTNVGCVVAIQGPLDASALSKAVAGLMRRHDSLRTQFFSGVSGPRQRIRPFEGFEPESQDLSELAAEAQLERLEALESDLGGRPFDLANELPLRACLARLAEERYRLYLYCPHIVVDGGSVAALARDLWQLYGDESARSAAAHSEPRVRYVDYAAWQTERLESGALDPAAGYWAERLRTPPPDLDLQADRREPAVRTLAAHPQRFELSAEVGERLRRLGRELDATSFMVQLAALVSFLARLSGQDDVAVGSPVSGRDHPDVADVVGFFVNTLVLRSDLSRARSFAEVVAAVRQTALEAYDHQDYPFDAILERARPPRDPGRLPLVRVLFGTGTALAPMRIGELSVRADYAGAYAGAREAFALPFKVDVNAGYKELVDGRIEWSLLFSADLFDAGTAERLAAQFEAHVVEASRQPAAAFREIPLRSPSAELPIRREARRDAFPLSFNQRDIWVQCRLHPDSTAYNCCLPVELLGALEPDRLRLALESAIRRHEALRVYFSPDGDASARQRVRDGAQLDLPTADLGGGSKAAASEALTAWEQRLATAPFDLERGPLYRFALARISSRRHRLMVVVHHLLVDAVQLVRLVREVLEEYASSSPPAGSSEPGPQYTDLAAWQSRRLAAGALAESHAYWRRVLERALPATALPASRSRPARRGFEADECSVLLPVPVLEGLRALRLRRGSSLFRLSVAALASVLHRTTGAPQVTLATPVSFQPQQLRQVVGYFGNAVPLCLRLDDDPRCSELLSRVDAAVAGAVAHAGYPLDEVVSRLKLPRDPDRPLFPICVSQVRALDGHWGSLEVHAADAYSPGIVFDLWVLVREQADGLKLQLKYRRDLFEPALVERLASALGIVLSSWAAGGDARVSQLPLMSEARRLDQLEGRGEPEAAPGYPTPAEALVRHADERPRAIAARCEGTRLSYADLDDRSRRLAGWLRQQGVGSESRVGLLGERSLGLLGSVLAVARSGAAFVPLELEHPDARLRGMLEASSCAVLLVDRERLARGSELVRGMSSPPTLLVWDAAPAGDPPRAGRGPRPSAATRVAGGGRDLACVFFTSGSTGMPKGVMVERRGMLNHLRAKCSVLGLSDRDVVAQNASQGFDIWVWQSLAPVMAGAQLVIYPDQVSRDPRLLLLALQRDRVSVLEMVPSMLEALLACAAETHEARLPALRILVSNAETLSVALSRRWFERFPGVQLVNTYGATECSDDTTHFFMESQPAAERSRVPVGAPIPGAPHLVVDRYLEPQLLGYPGQIAIGGRAVGRGYLGDPAATAAAFVPDPFGPPGARLYLSGDLGRWDEHGQLDFLGRSDDQVKVRGQRVELAEVEAALLRCPGVRQAAVVLRDGSHGARLSAYWVGDVADAAELRSGMARGLPGYMIPEDWLRLDALPRSLNGKVDRRALPEPGSAANGPGFEPPRDSVEAAIAEVWQQVLRVDRVGVHDNFFDLGGDSIQSILAASRLGQRGLRCSPKDLFEHQTIAELAPLVALESGPELESQAPVVGPIPLLPLQRELLEGSGWRLSHFNQALLLAAVGLEEDRLRLALQMLLDHHDMLRVRFRREATGWVQEAHGLGEQVSFEVIELGELSDERVVEQAQLVQESLDIELGPVFRAALLRGEQGDRLLLVAHHLVVDTVSWRILVEQLETAYDQMLDQRAMRLPPKTVSFQRWALDLEAWAAAGADGVDLWREALTGVRALPTDWARGPNHEASVAEVGFSVGRAATGALLGSRRALGVEPTELLLTALGRALAPWTDATHAAVFLESHGREPRGTGLDLTRTVGWFTAAYPLKLATARDLLLSDQLIQVKEAVRRVPAGGLGYGWHVAGAALPASPAPEISFNYLGQLDGLSDGGRFRLAPEASGATVDPARTRRVLLEVECYSLGQKLRVRLRYSRNRHRRSSISALSRRFRSEIDAVVALSADPANLRRTPSDFPLATLSQADVDALPSDVEDVYPLAPIQEGMLFHALDEPESSLYFEQGHLSLRGELDREAFGRAWSSVVANHPALRTVFRWEALEQPLQIVRSDPGVAVEFEDLEPLAPKHRERRVAERAAEDWARPFDLARGPLTRIRLLRLGPGRFEMLWSFHHILLDGWSVATLLSELSRAYAAALRGETAPASASPPYRDFVAWLRVQPAAPAREFWSELLRDFDTPTPLPRDSRPPSRRSRQAAEVQLALPSAALHGLEEWARARRVTLSAVVQAAWAILLGRFAGEQDVVFGATVAGRPAGLGGVESMVGAFINAVPVRARLDAAPTAAALARALHAQAVEARSFEHSLLSEIQQCSAVPAGRPLFDSLIVFENFPVEGLQGGFGGARATGLRARELTHYDLTVVVTPGDELCLRLCYAKDVFAAASAQRMAAALRGILTRLVRDGEVPLDRFDALSPQERLRIVEGFNPPPPHPVFEGQLTGLFAERVRADPERVAVRFGGEEWSYRELDARANRLARWLRSRGVGREDQVGIAGERSPGMLAAMLGVLKAGAAYLPLDPEQPDARLQGIIHAARPALVMSGASCAERLAGLAEGVARNGVACWEPAPRGSGLNDPSTWAELPAEPLPSCSGPHDLAYVFYTSGSSGVPKGAMVEHASMLNHLRSKLALLELDSDSVVAQTASHCFDISIWQFFAALLVGGRVSIYDRHTAQDPWRLLHGVGRDGVTVLETVPSMLEALLEGDVPERIAGGQLRQLICTGEALTPALCARWLSRVPAVPLVNAYGPTECADDVTHHVARTAPDPSQLRMPIGAPVPGARLYVLDQELRPLPVGCIGQIAVGGVAVGRGYLGEPSRTALGFRPDPFGEAGQRLYLTGDLGRWSDDGSLEYCGRFDGQVKIRGHRIEVGEIEAALGELPEVERCAVVARSDGREGRRLVGYWVGEATADRIRAGLAARLPGYMVPERLLHLDALPLTDSGKVDRRRLPEPPSATASGRPARSEAERTVAEAFAEVLGVENVTPEDDFFDLGGHSLTAIRLVSALRTRGIGVSIRQVFEQPLVADLARLVESSPAASVQQGIRRLEDRPHYPLSQAQRAQWFALKLHRDAAGGRPPLLLELRSELDLRCLERSLTALVARHEALRTSFGEVDGAPAQWIRTADEVPFQLEDLSREPPGDRAALLRERLLAQSSLELDLATAPLLRAVLYRLAPEHHLLCLRAPHIASDGRSDALMLRDLAELYAAFRDARQPQLAPLPVRYVDFAAWQGSRLGSGELAAEAEYWVERFRDGGPAPLSSRPRGRQHLAARARLGMAVVDSLKALSSRQGTTLFVALLSALKAVVARLSGRTDLVVGSTVAGRVHPDVEDLVGVFINPVALRSDLGGDPSFSELVRRVGRVVIEALAHQECPFDSWLDAVRRRGRLAPDWRPYQLIFVVEEQGPGLGVAGLAATAPPFERYGVPAPSRGAGTDMLTLEAVEDAEGWWLNLSGDPAALPEAVAPALLERWCSVLEQVARRPELLLSELDLLIEPDLGERPPEPVAETAAELVACLGPQQEVAVRSRSGVAVLPGAEWLDPHRVLRHVLAEEVDALAGPAELVDGLARVWRRVSAGRELPLRLAVRRVAAEVGVAGDLGSDCQVLTLLCDTRGSGVLWLESVEARGRVCGRPAGGDLAVRDAWGRRQPPGVWGLLSRGAEPGAGAWRARTLADGSVEAELPAPTAPVASGAGRPVYAAPIDAVERLVARCWRSALGPIEVGRDDEFVAAGGSSARAVTAALALCEAGLPGSPALLLEGGTLASIARRLSQGRRDETDAVPTSFQHALRAAARGSGDLTLQIELMANRPIGTAALRVALDRLAPRHDALGMRWETRGRLDLLLAGAAPPVPLEELELTAGRSGSAAWRTRLAAERRLVGTGSAGLRALVGRGPSGSPVRLALSACALFVDEAALAQLAVELDAELRGDAGGEPSRQSRTGFGDWLAIAERSGLHDESPAWQPARRWTAGASLETSAIDEPLPEPLRSAEPRVRRDALAAALAGALGGGVVELEPELRSEQSAHARIVGQLGRSPGTASPATGSGPRIRARLLRLSSELHSLSLVRIHESAVLHGWGETAPDVRLVLCEIGARCHVSGVARRGATAARWSRAGWGSAIAREVQRLSSGALESGLAGLGLGSEDLNEMLR